MSPSDQKAIWNHKIREAARECRLRQATTRKAARDLEKIDIQMSTRLLRGRSLTSIQKGQLRAILAGAVHTCARMWARGTVVTGLCPACGHENEDLARLWWKCKAEQYAHNREKARRTDTCCWFRKMARSWSGQRTTGTMKWRQSQPRKNRGAEWKTDAAETKGKR